MCPFLPVCSVVFMAPRYLIDGFNLIHAIGYLATRGVNAKTLASVRERLLDFLHGSFGDDSGRIEVVFDAHTSLKRLPYRTPRGISVRFAKVADDLIRELIEADTVPQSLYVVSNDHAVRDAAKHNGANPLSCDAFLDLAERHGKAPPIQDASETKPEATEREVDYWLKKFGDIDGPQAPT
jgi:predicted RNA-binding protein with PIN domain